VKRSSFEFLNWLQFFSLPLQFKKLPCKCLEGICNVAKSRSVTRYFARQLLNKHAKNYQNVEIITKFLQSTKVVSKSIKHLSKTKSLKRFPSLKLCFFHVFLSHLYFDCNCAKCKYGATMIESGHRHRVPSPQSGQSEWWSAGFRRFSWTAWASSLQFGCTAFQTWTCNCSHWIFE
jgi:hypothetical protein